MRTSAPAARACWRLARLPGTRSMSPKEAIITPGTIASAIALSISEVAVTQTGHPGPETSSIFGGSACRMPYLKMATVCPPQNSIKRTFCFDLPQISEINAPLYACCDRIITFSNFSHKLLEDGGTPNDCIPCSVDPKEFYPLPESVIQSGRRELFATANGREINFLAFWNNRNGNRKRLIDTLTAFKQFSLIHPDSMLFMNTDARDLEGVDVMTVVDELEGTDSPIVFNFKRMPTEQLNVLYNIADVTINISYWEGFGLSIAESLACGTPVICTRTGGMPEQAETERGPAGIILDPLARFMFGTIEVPYIYQDFVSIEQVVKALNTAYEQTRSSGVAPDIGEMGRQHILENFNAETMIRKFDELLTEEANKEITFKVWRTLTI